MKLAVILLGVAAIAVFGFGLFLARMLRAYDDSIGEVEW